MRLPRDLSGMNFAKALGRVGYRVVRQTGSHVRLIRDGSPQHHITIPAHDPLKIGTLASI
jgi:predicted RNA binding protein YcfA (HicA-like mRNA interferase family)